MKRQNAISRTAHSLRTWNWMSVFLLFGLCSGLMAADSVFSGTVIDTRTDKPLSEMTFKLYATDLETGQRQRETVSTNRDGAFEATIQTPAEVMVYWEFGDNENYLFDRDWLREHDLYRIDLGEIDADKKGIVLKTRTFATYTLAGTIKDAAGASCSAQVVYSSYDPMVRAEDGQYRFPCAPVGRDFELFFFTQDKREAKRITVKADQAVCDVQLERTLTLPGKVLLEDDQPGAGLEFAAYPQCNGTSLYNMRVDGTADQGGDFGLMYMCPGVNYQATWYGSARHNKEFKDGQYEFVAGAKDSITLRAERFIDNWQTPGHICISQETRCKELTNYCLDRQDNILACDGRKREILKISPEDKLLAAWKLGFAPQAIECREDGSILVAGPRKIVLLDTSGKVQKEAKIPGSMSTGIGWCGTDVYVAVRDGSNYAIYRMDEEFNGQERIVKGLRGCCSQMDFTVKDNTIYVAANCDFKVRKFDRDGREVGKFGKKHKKKGDNGFDGCCEPKNVCFDNEGNLYTSESGNCCVKKFTPVGQFLETMGSAEGIRGCVRVSIAVTQKRDKIYILDTGRNIIRLVKKPEVKAAAL